MNFIVYFVVLLIGIAIGYLLSFIYLYLVSSSGILKIDTEKDIETPVYVRVDREPIFLKNKFLILRVIRNFDNDSNENKINRKEN